METRDKRIDDYICKSAEFAQPILRELREIVHEACPAVEETMKWSFPHFMYKGMLCSMASFKQHCAFNFWKGDLILGDEQKSADAMGQFGRITSLKDLPSRRTLLKYLAEACRLNDGGVQRPATPKPRTEKKRLEVPSDFEAALKKNKKALATFEAFPFSKRKDYVEWVEEAKTDDTRGRRLQTSIEWLAEGKSRNWKYEKC
ncbi:MAG TPA: YdeI/OmpD-associated family protein [Terriglobales bacterium]|jgi:uncharacterized protein YdeI (YjbR/CyaY-like superfamily)|nr:YdeI/OmpD-associated family protein [Terriglobales bacterium]